MTMECGSRSEQVTGEIIMTCACSMMRFVISRVCVHVDHVDATRTFPYSTTTAKMAHSRNTPHTHLQSGTAAAYMNRVIGQTLVRRGFDGAEAGALTEMERLLEHRECTFPHLTVGCSTIVADHTIRHPEVI